MAFSPCGKRVLTGADDGTAMLWNAATGKMLRRFKGHDGPVTSVAFTPDGETILTASDDLSVRIWRAATGQELGRLSSLNQGRDWLTVTPQRYVDGSPGALKLLQWQVGNERVPFERYQKVY